MDCWLDKIFFSLNGWFFLKFTRLGPSQGGGGRNFIRSDGQTDK